MFSRFSTNITCDINSAILSGNIIDYLNETKYLGVILCSDMNISMMYLTKHVSIMYKPIHYYVAFVIV